MKRYIPVPLLFTALLAAGPLSPPPGPVSPTHKTLTEIEPRTPIGPATTPGDADSLYRITQPGSYYLTGDITGIPAGKHAVEIAASGVTLDLGGFAIRGTPGVDTLCGVISETGITRVTVRNGTVEEMGGSYGVFLWAHSRAEGLNLHGNTNTGLSLGLGGTALDCAAVQNGNFGIAAERGAVDRCRAISNGTVGISASSSSVRACVAASNTQHGFLVFASTIAQCAAEDNGGEGFATSRCVLDSCVSEGNTLNGFRVYEGSTLRGCSATGNSQNGINILATTAEDQDSLLVDCAAAQNAGSGFDIRETMARSCRASLNAGDGIRVRSECTVLDAHCQGNGAGAAVGAGIHLLGSTNRVEGAHCIGNDTGILAAAADNFIARNACRGNTTNFSIIAGNEAAPVVTNPGSNGFSTMTPWSNVAY